MNKASGLGAAFYPVDKGYKVTVMPDAKDPDTAAEVRLAFRNEREGGDAGKSTDKDKK